MTFFAPFLAVVFTVVFDRLSGGGFPMVILTSVVLLSTMLGAVGVSNVSDGHANSSDAEAKSLYCK